MINTNVKLMEIIKKDYEVIPTKPLEDQIKKMKSNRLTQIIATKMYGQRVIDIYNNVRQDLWSLERQDRKYKEQGVTLAPLHFDIKRHELYRDNSRTQIKNIGALLASLLDSWQALGATNEELYNLCCCSPHIIKSINSNDKNMRFSELFWVYNLDFDKHNVDWLDMEYPAPITHCVKEFMQEKVLEAMHNNSELQKQMHNKLFELFPQFEDAALTVTRDEEGNTVAVNKDKEIVGIIDKAEQLNEQVKQGLVEIFKIVYVEDNQEHELYSRLKSGCNNLMNILSDHGMDTDNIMGYLIASDENTISEFLDILVPKVMSQKELLKVFEDTMK